MDAVKALQAWLNMRRTLTGQPMRAGEPIFISPQRNPIKKATISEQFNKLAIRCGLEHKKFGKASEIRYRFHAHELRDSFRTVCTVCGLDYPVAEFFIGHSIDKLGYDKSPSVYPEHFRGQYAKLEAMLNIFSSQGAGLKKLEALEKTLNERERVIQALIQSGEQREAELKALNEKMEKIEGSKENLALLLQRVIELERRLEGKEGNTG